MIAETASALAGKASSQQRSRTTMHIGKVEQQNHIDSLVGDLVFKKGTYCSLWQVSWHLCLITLDKK